MKIPKTYTEERKVELIKAYQTEEPRPTYGQLAARFSLNHSCVQRILRRAGLAARSHGLEVKRSQAQLALAGDTVTPMSMEIVTDRGEVVTAITQEMTIEQIATIRTSLQQQYRLHEHDENPVAAVAILRELRMIEELIGKWLGMDKSPMEKKDDTLAEVRIVWDEPPKEEQK